MAFEDDACQEMPILRTCEGGREQECCVYWLYDSAPQCFYYLHSSKYLYGLKSVLEMVRALMSPWVINGGSKGNKL